MTLATFLFALIGLALGALVGYAYRNLDLEAAAGPPEHRPVLINGRHFYIVAAAEWAALSEKYGLDLPAVLPQTAIDVSEAATIDEDIVAAVEGQAVGHL